MRFCTFRRRKGEDPGRDRLGTLSGRSVVEFEGFEDLRSLLTEGDATATQGRTSHRLSDVVLRAPVPRPGKIVAAIVNTQGMLGGADVVLEWPRLDMKAPSTVIGPGERILAPKEGVRPEVELAAVIGSRLTSASPAKARKGIFGYTILNDVTAPSDSRSDAYQAYRRDATTGEIRKTTLRGPLFRSKNHDTFCPMGPWLVTPDELYVEDLRMTTKFRGRLVQDGSTAEYIFRPWDVASYVSGFLTLEPGDVISCGSVGWTREAIGNKDPTEFVLPKGQGQLQLEIEGIGILRNPVVPTYQ